MQTETETQRVPAAEVAIDLVREDIARGAAYLDDRSPGWLNEIDTDTLDLNYNHCCVLGQLEIGGHVLEHRSISWLCSHGFWFNSGNVADYDVLTREWLSLIEQRRGDKID